MSIIGKPFVCDVCWKAFSNEDDMNLHLDKKHTKYGVCPICKELELLEGHHYSYEDYEYDKSKNRIKICNRCHGRQQNVQAQIREGIQLIYIGHTLRKY